MTDITQHTDYRQVIAAINQRIQTTLNRVMLVVD